MIIKDDGVWAETVSGFVNLNYFYRVLFVDNLPSESQILLTDMNFYLKKFVMLLSTDIDTHMVISHSECDALFEYFFEKDQVFFQENDCFWMYYDESFININQSRRWKVIEYTFPDENWINYSYELEFLDGGFIEVPDGVRDFFCKQFNLPLVAKRHNFSSVSERHEKFVWPEISLEKYVKTEHNKHLWFCEKID